MEKYKKKNIGILNQDNIYTNLGLIVSDECVHSIKLALFQGNDKNIFKDRKEFTGSVFNQLNDAYETPNLYNKTQATFEMLLGKDTRDYPDVAIREVLLNAIVHRDYFTG